MVVVAGSLVELTGTLSVLKAMGSLSGIVSGGLGNCLSYILHFYEAGLARFHLHVFTSGCSEASLSFARVLTG